MMPLSIQLKYLIPPAYEPIYKTGFKDVYLDGSTLTLLVVWNRKSESITNDIFSCDCRNIITEVRRHKVKNLISDVTMNKFIVPAELQIWYATEIASKLNEAGLEKCAIIIDNDLNKLSSLEAIMDDFSKIKGSQAIQTRFFPSLEKTHHWLRV